MWLVVVAWGILTVIKKTAKNTVLVATSGDTGGAASGFLGVKGVEVIIPYPSGKVSDIGATVNYARAKHQSA
jgi:threonine synthase